MINPNYVRDVTVYHNAKTNGTDDWQRAEYRECSWFQDNIQSTASNVLSNSSVYTVRIPAAESIPLSEGDVLVMGIVADEVSLELPLRDILQKYKPNACRVVDWRDNTKVNSGKHVRVTGG